DQRRDDPRFAVHAFQVPVPGEGHEDIAEGKQGNGYQARMIHVGRPQRISGMGPTTRYYLSKFKTLQARPQRLQEQISKGARPVGRSADGNLDSSPAGGSVS